jgi:PST family polysaccharide transporter
LELGKPSFSVQRPDITKGEVDALFWLSVLSSAASALILALSAYPISLFYDDPRLQRLTIAIAGLSLIAGLPTVPYALLAKESRFKALAILDVVATTAQPCRPGGLPSSFAASFRQG